MSFDSSELTIGAGAASGTIKIWDVEEAKGMNGVDAWCICIENINCNCVMQLSLF